MPRALRGRVEPLDHFVLGHLSILGRLSALGSPHAAKRFIGFAIVVRTRSRASRITHRSQEHRAFHGLFRAWPAAAAAAACDHCGFSAELTFETDYCIEIS